MNLNQSNIDYSIKNCQIYFKSCQIILKIVNFGRHFGLFDQIRPFSIKFNDLRYKFEYKIKFGHGF